MRINIVLPSMKISGGTIEAVRLGKDINGFNGCETNIISLWRSPSDFHAENIPVIQLSSLMTNVKLAFFQLPILATIFFRFVKYRRAEAKKKDVDDQWVFTHFATLPFSLLVHKKNCLYFVQDLEWNFVDQAMLARLLKYFILVIYKRGRVIVANRYLSQQLAMHGINSIYEAPIWADGRFSVKSKGPRELDVIMVLRKGSHKRLDLYLDFISEARRRTPAISLGVITTEREIADVVKSSVDICLLRPDLLVMASTYARSRVFLHLSEHEGFGLPPLEAMGAGCIPLCRDSGGVRAYMRGPLEPLVFPLNTDIESVVDRVEALLADDQLRANISTSAKLIFEEGLEQASKRVTTLATVFNFC